MSLNKAIYYGKEHRKPYYGSRSFDSACRPGGSCPYCFKNRLHANIIRMIIADETAEDFYLLYRIKGKSIYLRKY